MQIGPKLLSCQVCCAMHLVKYPFLELAAAGRILLVIRAEAVDIFGGPENANTWWLIPLSKWVITPVINGISRVNPLIIGFVTHLLSGMNHQVGFFVIDV